MKLLLVVLNLIFIPLLLAFEYKIQPQKVSSEIYCFFGAPQAINKDNNGNMVNSCFVDMGESYLVIDSGPTYNYAKEVYGVMKTIKDQPIAYVINTHAHDDHWLGNSYYKKLGVDIIGSAQFKNEAKVEVTRMQRNVTKEAYENTTQEFPNLFVEDKQTLTINKKTVIFSRVHDKAHSSSDLLVYIPSKSALFAGDLVFNDRVPSLRDGNINRWIEELSKMKEGTYTYIIGGHGSLVDKHSIDITYEYLVTLKEELVSALDEGLGIDDAVNSIVMEKFKDIAMYDVLHRQNVETAYRTLEWEE
ncbi:MBL fold metallo-hydrolase [Sulfurimonas microaerophilic]|uniref:MBL fold metallo-hydrolase n=1 Tax=Sulfurimonas microaerophilic TaxID=3058392 RepID=UPI002714CB33|nr:MBL fold metallo-hydrolase [Sulfurimonas sp. hsl 1-7]